MIYPASPSGGSERWLRSWKCTADPNSQIPTRVKFTIPEFSVAGCSSSIPKTGEMLSARVRCLCTLLIVMVWPTMHETDTNAQFELTAERVRRSALLRVLMMLRAPHWVPRSTGPWFDQSKLPPKASRLQKFGGLILQATGAHFWIHTEKIKFYLFTILIRLIRQLGWRSKGDWEWWRSVS